MKYKKSIWLSFMSTLFLFLVLSYVFIGINTRNKQELQDFRYIGTRSLDLVSLYSEGELELIYYDSLSRIIFPRSLFFLGDNGGFYEPSECGNVAGYQMWINEDSECRPKYMHSLGEIFNEASKDFQKDERYIRHYFTYLGKGTFVASPIDNIELSKNDAEYIVRPAFKIDTGYDMDLYDLAFDRAKELRNECMNVIDYETCLKEKLAHYSMEENNLRWTDDCNSGDERIFYSFIKQYEDCINSFADNCICKINMDIARADISNQDFEIIIKDDGNISMGRFHKMMDFNPALFGVPDNYGFTSVIKILLRYGDQGELLGVKLTDQDNLGWSQISDTFVDDELLVFKSTQNACWEDYNVVNDIDLAFVSDKGDYPYCGMFTRAARICVEQGNEFLVHDGFILREKKIPLKFGIYVPDIFPPEKINFSVENDPNDEQVINITFYRSEEEDISHYNIYIEDEEFNSLDLLEPKLVIYDKDLVLNPHTISYDVEEDDVIYYVTITPVDVFGNENKDFEIKTVISEDNLAPAVVPIRNVVFHSSEEENNMELIDVAVGNVWTESGISGSIIINENLEIDIDEETLSSMLSLPVDPSNFGLPNTVFTDAINNVGFNSAGKTLKQLFLEIGLEFNVNPALLAAQATQESGMGTNNHCTIQVGKTALTGCDWDISDCNTGCISENACASDVAQIRCTANVLNRAYEAANGEIEYLTYAECKDYVNDNDQMWNCIFCKSEDNFTEPCQYKENVFQFYAQWHNYFFGGS